MDWFNRFKEKTLLKYLGFTSRPEKINRYLDGKNIQRTANCTKIDLSKIRVAAVQSRLVLIKNPLDYVEKMYLQTARAAAQGAQLVVFPEDNAAHLLGMLPGMEKLARQSSFDDALGSLGDDVQAADIFKFLGPVTKKIFWHTFSQLSKRFGVYIMGGSILIPDPRGKVINQAYLFDPRGKEIGTQTKAHLLPLEAQWGLSCGNDLKVSATPLGNLAFPVCMDATYFETFRILELQEADIVIIPIANPESYNFWKALRGIWPRVQESYVYGIKSAMVGQDFFGFNFTGKAGIFAPLEISPNQDGVLAEAQHFDQETIVTSDLDINLLRSTRSSSEYFGDRNLKLYQRYFPSIYQQPQFPGTT